MACLVHLLLNTAVHDKDNQGKHQAIPQTTTLKTQIYLPVFQAEVKDYFAKIYKQFYVVIDWLSRRDE